MEERRFVENCEYYGSNRCFINLYMAERSVTESITYELVTRPLGIETFCFRDVQLCGRSLIIL